VPGDMLIGDIGLRVYYLGLCWPGILAKRIYAGYLFRSSNNFSYKLVITYCCLTMVSDLGDPQFVFVHAPIFDQSLSQHVDDERRPKLAC